MIYEFLRPFIEEGMVYVTELPLYRITVNKGDAAYYYTEKEFQDAVESFRRRNIKIQTSRFKGLGEMNGEDLHEVGFNKDKRKLVQVSMDDATMAADIVDKIMGDDTTFRKEILSMVNSDELEID